MRKSKNDNAYNDMAALVAAAGVGLAGAGMIYSKSQEQKSADRRRAAAQSAANDLHKAQQQSLYYSNPAEAHRAHPFDYVVEVERDDDFYGRLFNIEAGEGGRYQKLNRWRVRYADGAIVHYYGELLPSFQ